jgi:hypothetical protein
MREGIPPSISSLTSGTLDILHHIPAITALWTAKKITPKQHYSEPRSPTAIIRKDLRPHSKRVYQLPPCAPTMDLMIEAKDKEQAIFSLRRKWGIEGGVPDEWFLQGAKMDEVREIPTEMGKRVFYEEGEEWRFKGPILMPARVKKVLERLDREIGKLAEDEKMERRRLEGEKDRVLEEWEREKRVKWGLESKCENVEGNFTVAKLQSKKSSTGIDGVDTNHEDQEWIPTAEAGPKSNSKRKRTVAESSVEDASNFNTTQLRKPTAKGKVHKLSATMSNGGKALASKASEETSARTRKVKSRMQT